MKLVLNIMLFSILLAACDAVQESTSRSEQEIQEIQKSYTPAWAKDASIYEVNMRQFTAEGTFEAFSTHLPRIKDMGVKIIWLMPIHPISKVKRKGDLGSPYAVANYLEVNPEYGSMADFDAMVAKIHDLDMKIIIDWVPNHTGWDNPWITAHPDWYTQNDEGEIIDPIDYNTGESWGWTDVADLNYDNEEMRREMISSLKYYGVPDDFWQEANEELKKVGDIFLLAEGDVVKQRNEGGFHADYGWTLHHILNDIAKGEANVEEVWKYYQEDTTNFEKGYHMMFTSNHDENTWAGSVFERMGDAHKAMAVFTCTFDGMPLIYGGQEEPMKKRLEFFKKDEIGFKDYAYQDFYTDLFQMKKDNQALWNGEFGAPPVSLSESKEVIAFARAKGSNIVTTLINFSDSEKSITLQNIKDLAGQKVELQEGSKVTSDAVVLDAWGYSVFSTK